MGWEGLLFFLRECFSEKRVLLFVFQEKQGGAECIQRTLSQSSALQAFNGYKKVSHGLQRSLGSLVCCCLGKLL